MRSFLAVFAIALALGAGVAHAASNQPAQTPAHRPNYYNWLQGGGG